MDVSSFLAGKIIDHLLRNQSYTPPSTIYLAAFTGDPFNGGAEVGTAGSNGYARQALALNAAASSATANTSQIQVTLPSTLSSSTRVDWFAIYDALTGGNMLGRIPFTGTSLEATVVASTDTFTTGVAHGLSTDNRVAFSDLGTLPAGITAGVEYFVLASGLTASAFKVSTTSGGSALDVTADGGCIVRLIAGQLFSASNIIQVAAGALTLTFAAGG